MRRSHLNEEQIAIALKQAELGTAVAEVCRKMGIPEATFFGWKQKYGGLGPSELRRLKQLEEENRSSSGCWPTSTWTRRCCRTFWR